MVRPGALTLGGKAEAHPAWRRAAALLPPGRLLSRQNLASHSGTQREDRGQEAYTPTRGSGWVQGEPFSEDRQAAAQVAQRGCAVSVHGCFQDPTG